MARVSLGSAALIGLGLLAHTFRAQRVTAGLARRFLALEEIIEGLDLIDPDQPFLVTPLHEGFVDALVLAHLPLKLRFVARDELFDWPILGRVLRSSNQIHVMPENRVAGHRRLVADIASAVADGESVVMFPQGSILGIEAAFHRGPFHIADRLGIPVLPVVITGTHRVWEHPYTNRLRFDQTVFMRVLEPIAIGQAEAEMRDLERRMKQIALTAPAPPRRFDPGTDGFWDDYAYEIDPAFEDVAIRVANHRASLTVTEA